MLGKTHRTGGITVALAGFIFLDAQGLLLPDVNPFLQLIILYAFAMYGSTWPDLDHHWGSVPSRDIFSKMCHMVLHLTTKTRKRMLEAGANKKNLGFKLLGIFDAKHRSIQTHSDLTLVSILGLVYWLTHDGGFTGTNAALIQLIGVGFAFGILAHLILDGITPEGVWFTSFMVINTVLRRKILPEKVSLVPHKQFFATGNQWETIIMWVIRAASVLMTLYIIYISTPYQVDFAKLGS